MNRKSKFAWLWLGLLIAADLVVPWCVVGQNGTFSGPFLFWIVWAAVAVVSMFLLFARWSS